MTEPAPNQGNPATVEGLRTSLVGQDHDHSSLNIVALGANKTGLNRSQILEAVETAAQQLEERGRQDGADLLWDLHDRINGFCASHAILNLN